MFRCNGNAIMGQTGDSFQISDFFLRVNPFLYTWAFKELPEKKGKDIEIFFHYCLGKKYQFI